MKSHKTHKDRAAGAPRDCMLRDVARLADLQRRIDQRQCAGRPVTREKERFQDLLARSSAQVERRERLAPPTAYPTALPIVDHREEILTACREHQVVIVAGETGSGKTTQLPKVLLELGHGRRGMIGCTQPRRLAATSVCERVADELGVSSTGIVGYQVRFDNKTTRDTMIKFMTDGILLTETQSDRELLAYDALIIDEVHERTLNIDFLLGYLKNLLPRRPDFKLVISSATLDVERFSGFFGEAPVIEVPGRTYPVEVLYEPPRDREGDLSADIATAVDQITQLDPKGDILVFLSGEREIRDAAQLLEGRGWPDTIVLPLYARLPAAQQRKVFKVGGRRRIVLATNVAETSVTIPGIHTVIDPGMARIKRYNPRTQVEKLHIEGISQASANQRKGRCGRIAPGVCLRLYDEEDFTRRAEYTDPEIKRSSLASVILRMLDLRLGAVEAFPFLDPPSSTAIRDGYRELRELGGLDQDKQLTPMGRTLARFSVEPRLARMLIEGSRNKALPDLLTVVSALSSDDPRLRPPDRQEEADQAHARYATQTSDFSALLLLWRSIHETRKACGSKGKFRGYCKREFLSLRRIREWDALRSQLADECKQAKLTMQGDPVNEEQLHRSVVVGLLNKIGLKEDRAGYRGARGIHYFIHPGSCLFGRNPEWVMAAELVETSRLYGRCIGQVDPQWIEPLARHVCRYSYGPPYWDERHGFVRAEETVLLYGLPLSQGKRRHYGPIDPEASRRIFIEHALVQGELRTPPAVIRKNLETMARVQALEAKIRRRDIMIIDADIAAFYDRQLPTQVYSGDSLKRWLERADSDTIRQLTLTEEALMLRTTEDVTQHEHPDHLDYQGVRLHLTYRFARGKEDDGVTAVIPVTVLQELPAFPFEWLVPGLIVEKVTQLLKGLPKRYRRDLVPMPRTVDAFLSEVEPLREPLRDALATWVLRHHGNRIPDDAWPAELEPHLQMRFVVEDEAGEILAVGRDLKALKTDIGEQVESLPVPEEQQSTWSRSGVTDWDFDRLDEDVDVGSQGWKVIQYPGLEDDGDSVALRLFETREAARQHTAYGLVRLTLLSLPAEGKQLQALPKLSGVVALTQMQLGISDVPLRDHIIRRAVADACGFFDPDIPRDRDAFIACIMDRKAGFYPGGRDLMRDITRYAESAVGLLAELEGGSGEAGAAAAEDIRAQLAGLFPRDFILTVPRVQLGEYARYLKAIGIRLERLRLSPEKDAQKLAQLAPYMERLESTRGLDAGVVTAYRWLLEEWRVSLFAQELGTRERVSAKRLDKLWATATGS